VGQVDDLIEEIRGTTAEGGRVLVTTLTKKMAEQLASYMDGLGIRTKYVHSEIDALERVSILRELRLAEFDVLVGVNLLREGLDLPEVSLVAVMDADKEGFLRSRTSLIQTAGRAARNLAGRVVMYADSITDSMRDAIAETGRRREIQTAYNAAHGVVPRGIVKTREEIIRATSIADSMKRDEAPAALVDPGEDPERAAARIEKLMLESAARLEFEEAARLRDELRKVLREIPGASGHRG